MPYTPHPSAASDTLCASRYLLSGGLRQLLDLLRLLLVLEGLSHVFSGLCNISSRPDIDLWHRLLGLSCPGDACFLSTLSCLREALRQLCQPPLLVCSPLHPLTGYRSSQRCLSNILLQLRPNELLLAFFFCWYGWSLFDGWAERSHNTRYDMVNMFRGPPAVAQVNDVAFPGRFGRV